MSFLTGDRNTPSEKAEIFQFPPAAGVTIYRGAMVAIDASGNANPAGPTAGFTVVGRAENSTNDFPVPPTLTPGVLPHGVVTTGGAPSIRVRRGACFAWDNSVGSPDQLGAGDWGASCYAVDDHTVAKTNGGGTRPLAGVFRGLTATGGAWVQM